MDKFEVGMLVRSKAGHDHGHVYMIVAIDDQFVYVADGRLRLIDHPKKKKRKHLQLIHRHYEMAGLDDTQVKYILKMYNREEA